MTFTSVGVYQSVSITLPYLGSGSNSVSVTINHSYSTSDANYASAVYSGCGISATGVMTLPVYTTTPTISVDNQVTVTSLGTATYQISINLPPLLNSITVTLTVPGSYITASPTSVVFTTSSYSAQTITVTSILAISTTSVTSTISHTVTTTDTLWSTYTKSPPSLQSVVTVILSSYAGVTFTNSYLNIAYSESGTYTINLNSVPTSAVTVTVTSSPTTVTFTPSSFSLSTTTAQTITVTVASAPTTVTSLDYPVTMIHTLSSSDSNYNGLVYDTIIDVINTCTPAVYDWTNINSCSTTTISGFTTTSGIPVPCSVGYYYSSGCTICPAGSYCPDGVNSYACSSGYYTTTTGQSSCTRTAAGYTWVSASVAPSTAVTSGSFSLPGSTASTACLAGDYCPYTTLNVEFKCALGTYSTTTGKSSCTTCPQGSSCTYTSTATCSPTTLYSPAGRPECFQCSAVFTSCTSSVITLVTESNSISSNTISSCTNQICTIRNNFQAYYCPPGTYYSSGACVSCVGSYACNSAPTALPSTCTTPNYN